MIAANLQHENIVQYKYYKKDKKNNNFEYHIVMDLMEGQDMLSYINNPKFGPPKDIDKIKKIGRQILSGIKYLHEHNTIH